jgi:Fe-S cluster biogenesis protein NfuA
MVREKAEAAIRDYIRPLVEADGGRIELLDASETRVVVQLTGTCQGCPGRVYTLTRVIEPALKRLLGPNIVLEGR